MDEQFISKTEWVPLNKRDHLSLIHICGIAAGTLVANLLWTIIFTLIQPLSEKTQLLDWIRTLLLFYGSLAGFVINPILGVYSDATMCRFGRRRIYMIIGGVILIFGLLLMMFCMEIGHWLKPDQEDGKNEAQKAILIVSIIICFTAGNIVQAPARTLCSDVTPPRQQVLMSNICQVYAGLGGILTNLVGGLELYKHVHMSQETFILAVCGSISFVAMVITIIVTPEERLTEKPPTVNPFCQILGAVKKMPKEFIRILPPFVLAYAANYQYGYQFSHFMGRDIFHGDNNPKAPQEDQDAYERGVSWSMMCNVMNYSFQFVYGFLNTKICQILGMKLVLIIGLGLLTAGFVCFFFVSNKYAYLAITIPLGIGNLIYTAIPFAVVSIIIPTEDLGNNLGILTCCGVFAQQLSNFGIGRGIDQVWKDEIKKSRYDIGVSSILGFCAFVSAFFMITPQVDEHQQLYEKVPESTDVTGTTPETKSLM